MSQLVVYSVCKRVTKTDDVNAVLRESLVWKSMASKFSIEDIGIFFALIIGIGSFWNRKKIDAYLMDTVTHLNA